jgi:phosphoglucosamine mutase
MKLGWAAGRVLGSRGTRKVLIGKDTRISGYMFESALVAGLTAVGMDSHLTGPLPTPAIAYLTKTLRAAAGIVISASHNPYDDNGIKFFSSTGEKLPDHLEEAIEAELERPLECVTSRELGKAYRMEDATGRYIEFCKAAFPGRQDLSGIHIVVDCAHGATYQIAPAVLTELGATVHVIGNQPNGININDHCGATSLELLQKTVTERNADLGIALDGDGDRVMMVDHKGDILDGDHLIYVIAAYQHARGEFTGGVVGTLMSNMGLELALASLDIPFVRARVGDRHVMEQLVANGWLLGGETSGHVICRDVVTTGDGVVTALKVLSVMRDTGRTLRELAETMPCLPQEIVNVRFNGGIDPLEENAVKTAVEQAESALDVASDNPKGRVLLRKSGTEPVIRVMVEAGDETLAAHWAGFIAEALNETQISGRETV